MELRICQVLSINICFTACLCASFMPLLLFVHWSEQQVRAQALREAAAMRTNRGPATAEASNAEPSTSSHPLGQV